MFTYDWMVMTVQSYCLKAGGQDIHSAMPLVLGIRVIKGGHKNKNKQGIG